jgi:hypothetical protein
MFDRQERIDAAHRKTDGIVICQVEYYEIMRGWFAPRTDCAGFHQKTAWRRLCAKLRDQVANAIGDFGNPDGAKSSQPRDPGSQRE